MNLYRETQKIITREPITMKYYEEIRKYQPLSASEERELLELAKEGDIAARDRIIESQLKFVVTMARRAKTSANINDLIDEGNLGLIEAIDNYDLSSPVRFSSYAVHWINKTISAYIANNDKLVKVKNANRVYIYVNKFRNKFFAENQRYPTDDELREYAALNGVEFPKTQVFNTVVASLDNFNMDANDFITDDIVREAELAMSSNNVEADIDRYDKSAMVDKLLSDCTDDERDMLTMLYGIGRKEETIVSIAAMKCMTPAKVKNICKKALKKIKNKNKNINFYGEA